MLHVRKQTSSEMCRKDDRWRSRSCECCGAADFLAAVRAGGRALLVVVLMIKYGSSSRLFRVSPKRVLCCCRRAKLQFEGFKKAARFGIRGHSKRPPRLDIEVATRPTWREEGTREPLGNGEQNIRYESNLEVSCVGSGRHSSAPVGTIKNEGHQRSLPAKPLRHAQLLISSADSRERNSGGEPRQPRQAAQLLPCLMSGCLEKLSLVCGALSGFDSASLQSLDSSAGLGGLQRTPIKRTRGDGGSRGDADGDGTFDLPQPKRTAHDGAPDGDGGDKRGGGDASAQKPLGKQQRRVPDERRKLSRQISAYLRFGVLTLPEGCAIRLNNKKAKGSDAGTTEYRGAFNTLLQIVFGDSLGPWSHVTNWLYVHSGELGPQGRAARPSCALEVLQSRIWRNCGRLSGAVPGV